MQNTDTTPLAHQLRPTRLSDIVGQDHLLAPNMPITAMVEQNNLQSFLLWGPSGSGKTTIAKVIASTCNYEVITISAVLAGVKDIRQAVARGQHNQNNNQKTILFIDEIHRFNKSQQDALLPHVESGAVILIGATTENPSFELNHALLSRLLIFITHPLTATALNTILTRAWKHPPHQDIIDLLITTADGDGRRLIKLYRNSPQRQPTTTHPHHRSSPPLN